MAFSIITFVGDNGEKITWVGDNSGEIVWIGNGTPDLPFVPGSFPPRGPVTLQKVIASYLYVQYADDDNLQAFVQAFNEAGQSYVDLFNALPLPVYTSVGIAGPLLDWVAAGLYGVSRPALPNGFSTLLGPLNTWTPDTVPLAALRRSATSIYYTADDDTFRRILTWALYRGDGKVFNLRWL